MQDKLKEAPLGTHDSSGQGNNQDKWICQCKFNYKNVNCISRLLEKLSMFSFSYIKFIKASYLLKAKKEI